MAYFSYFLTKRQVTLFFVTLISLLLIDCRKKELPVDELIYLGRVYFYVDMPEIRGYTSTRTGEPLCIYTVKLVLAYPADNRHIAVEINRKKVAIIDRVRNQLERYPESAFLGDKVNNLKVPIMDSINQLLVSGKILALLLQSVDVHPISQTKI